MPPAYATRADLALQSLSAPAASAISTAAQDAALEAASRVVDSYLASRYDPPLQGTPPADIVSATCDIAAYRLMKLRGFNPQTGDAEQFLAGYDRALRYLRDVADGKATPAGISDSSVGGTETGTQTDAPFVVAQAPGSEGTVGTFYEPPSSHVETDAATLGRPRRRGW
jgi:phage gp36-like protein